jgi:sphingomyelin phosphodiesterase
MHDCGVPDNPFDGNWTIPLPPKPDIKRHGGDAPTRTEDHPVFKVIQLSDLHFDFSYQNGTEALCGKPVCCQGEPSPHAKIAAGYWGTLASW